MSQIPNKPLFRNQRTNPFGKYVTGFFNYRTELLPLARGTTTIPQHVLVLGFWGGLLFGGKKLLDIYNEEHRFHNEMIYKTHQTAATGANYRLKYYTADTQPHSETIKPLHDHIAMRPDVIFGNNKVWGAISESASNVNTSVRARELQVDSLMMQGGYNWNSHRYTKAKPASDYDALRLRALYNLATAAYHENRAPGFFIPLSAQIKMEQIQKEKVA
jgi:hypothetical protein